MLAPPNGPCGVGFSKVFLHQPPPMNVSDMKRPSALNPHLCSVHPSVFRPHLPPFTTTLFPFSSSQLHFSQQFSLSLVPSSYPSSTFEPTGHPIDNHQPGQDFNQLPNLRPLRVEKLPRWQSEAHDTQSSTNRNFTDFKMNPHQKNKVDVKVRPFYALFPSITSSSPPPALVVVVACSFTPLCTMAPVTHPRPFFLARPYNRSTRTAIMAFTTIAILKSPREGNAGRGGHLFKKEKSNKTLKTKPW
jgi:hypothetical protein